MIEQTEETLDPASWQRVINCRCKVQCHHRYCENDRAGQTEFVSPLNCGTDEQRNPGDDRHQPDSGAKAVGDLFAR